MKIDLFQTDAFSSKLFGGNPAAICPLEYWLEDEILQKIANENNLSETAFFVKNKTEYHIRWFTPTIEVDLCGHATLASSYVIYEYLKHLEDEIIFKSKSGKLSVIKKHGLIYLNFPSRPAQNIMNIENLEWEKAFGLVPLDVLKSRDYLFVFDSEDKIIKLKPNFEYLEKLDCLGIITTSRGSKYDFVSRFFAPRAGILEDPVTGSAHCTLIPYWSNQLNKNILTAYQASNRGGELFCENIEERVLIGGKCVLYLKGEIQL